MAERGKIPAFSVILFAVALSVVGIASFRMLNVQYKPANTERSITVSYSMPEASPEAIESEVTSRIEGVLSGLAGCRGTSSVSKPSSGSVTVKFDKRTDMQAARFEVASAIRNIYSSLPSGVSYPSISVDSRGTKSGPAIRYLLKSELPSVEIATYARRHISEPLSLLEDVDRVTINGALPYRWVITFDNEKAVASGVTAEDIRQAFTEAFADVYVGMASYSPCPVSESPASFAASDSSRQAVPKVPKMLAAVRLSAPKNVDFSSIAVRNSDNRVYRLADLATWKFEEDPPTSYHRINGLNSVSLDVYVSQEENLLKSVKAIKSRMADLQTQFPREISVSVGYDSSEYVSRELNKIYFRTGLCLLILLLLVVAVNHSWRSMIVMALSLVVNILISVSLYALLHIPVHIYTLAGITVSLGIVIDSAVMMSDHYSYYRNRSVIVDLIEAVMTTLAALFMIMLLPESERVNLTDFIYVIAINLCVSTVVAYLFIPALIDYIPFGRSLRHSASSGRQPSTKTDSSANLENNADSRQKTVLESSMSNIFDTGEKPAGNTLLRKGLWRKFVERHRRRSRKFVLGWRRFYERYIYWGVRHRYIYIIACIAAFGIPLCLIPKAETKKQGEFYEKFVRPVISWRPYVDNRSVIDKIAGSSFALFYRSLDNGNFYREPEKRVLYIRAGMPEGCSVAQLNEVIKSMENYLSSFDEISVFNTDIVSPQSGTITVEFKPEYEYTNFPSELKSKVSVMAADFGGANWAVYGIDPLSFNNNVVTGSKSNRITLTGYNYRELIGYAEILCDRLAEHRRFIDPQIWSSAWDGKPVAEFVMDYDFERMASVGISPYSYYTALSQYLYDRTIMSEADSPDHASVVLRSSSVDDYDLWHLANVPVTADSVSVALSDVGKIEKKLTGLEIRKKNQSYEVNVCYDFAGSYELEDNLSQEQIQYMNDNVLPVGFTAKKPGRGWFGQHKDRYAWLIMLIVLAIYVMLAISFESLRLPFAVILMVPVSFVGLFLVFGLSKITFDQGGFAAFVMLCGTTVNAGIYMINEWRSIGCQSVMPGIPQSASSSAASCRHSVRSYVRAYSRKVKPIMLTVVSTVAGLIPFLTDGPTEVFWFSFAAGTIGGMLVSIPALVFIFPVFVVKRPNTSPHRPKASANKWYGLFLCKARKVI